MRKWDKLLPAGPARIRRRWGRHDTLRGELAAALAELRQVRRERDELDAAVTVSAASESALFDRVWELEREMTALIGPDSDAP